MPVAPVPPTTFQFHSTAYRIGAALRDKKNLFLLEYERSHLNGGGTRVARRGLKAGVERKLGAVALRIGSFDGKLTGGLGADFNRFSLAYGFTGRYDKDLPGQGGRTGHAFQLMYSF